MPIKPLGSQPSKPLPERAQNEQRILEYLVENGPTDRPTLAEKMGLSRPAILEIIRRLEDEKLVVSAGESAAGKRGPRSVLYTINGELAIVAGVELHPTRASARVALIDGTIVGFAAIQQETPISPEDLLEQVLTKALEASEWQPSDLSAMVIATPGILGEDGDLKILFGYPDWTQGYLERLRRRFDVPIVLDNDVKLAAVAERKLGVASGVDDFALINYSRGIGSAIVTDGRLLRGRNGAAGEIGALPIRYPPDSESTRKFRDYAGEVALAVELQRLGEHGTDPVSFLKTGQSSPAYPAFMTELSRRISEGVIPVCTIANPAIVILTGPVALSAGEPLLREVSSRLKEVLLFPPQLELSTLGQEGASHGALFTALANIRRLVFSALPGSLVVKSRLVRTKQVNT